MPASNLQQFSLLFVTVDGPLLAQEQDVTITRNTNAQPVSTVPLGYAGDSPGAAMVEIDVKNAIPAAGFEFNAGQIMLSLSPADVYLIGPAGQQLKSTVNIYQDTTMHGVNKAAEYSFRCRGPMVDWET